MTTHLEHLNESHTQIQVCHITANQAQTEEQANRDDSAEVYAAGHFDGLSTIEKGGCASQQLGHEGCERQVPCREANRYDNIRMRISRTQGKKGNSIR